MKAEKHAEVVPPKRNSRRETDGKIAHRDARWEFALGVWTEKLLGYLMGSDDIAPSQCIANRRHNHKTT